MRALVAVWIALLGCSPSEQAGAPEPQRPREKGRVMSDALSPALEAELAAIRKDPGVSVGFGFKADIPYVPNRADSLIASRDPGVTVRLVAAALAALLLAACSGVIDNCPNGLPDGPPGMPMRR
jgi:hypothetical protein